MSLAEALAALDARFADDQAAEAARMRRDGVGQAIIDAITAENAKRFAAMREGAAAGVVMAPANDNGLAAMPPQGAA